VNKKRIRDTVFLSAGIGIGSGIALLLAPGSGEDMRYALGRGYRKTVKKIGRHTEDLRGRAEGCWSTPRACASLVPSWTA
jgi:gas vesicle protein